MCTGADITGHKRNLSGSQALAEPESGGHGGSGRWTCPGQSVGLVGSTDGEAETGEGPVDQEPDACGGGGERER